MPAEQLQFVEGRLASLAAGGLNTPTEEELFREYIGLAETLRESIRLGDQDSSVAEEVEASNSPTPSSPRQPIPQQWFLRRVSSSPTLISIERTQSEEELWQRVGGPEAELILAAVQQDLIAGVVERAQTEELGGDPNDFDLSRAPSFSPFADDDVRRARAAAPPYSPPPPVYLPRPPTYKDHRLRPDFLGLAEGLEENARQQEKEPLEYVTAIGEIAEDPIEISSESSKEIEESSRNPRDLFPLGCKAGEQLVKTRQENRGTTTPILVHGPLPLLHHKSKRTSTGSVRDQNKQLSTYHSPIRELKGNI
ncbi:uncharacterized protein FIBRA_09064 [Fibroporia radiculosa]|uniref:Uncharacterized protein n=1 Tax=Fibroporia radiculosa TaxID=599839 RepID=J4ICP4_9APHY|nr:uncharacterized protein FIBRA_09064 [Fibroporia radiculosa]CCM06766.1 predicted protein [Fibroporia radiculosa]